MSEQSTLPVSKTQHDTKADKLLTQFYWVFIAAAGIGLAAIILFAVQAGSLAQYFGVLATSLLTAAAALALGALAGFLFGIPFAARDERPSDQAANEPGKQTETPPVPKYATPLRPYRPNTNLEQISDWLTKILVGVGLVQLSQVPGALETFGSFVSPALGGWKTSAIFGIADLMYFLVLGFLLLFLWTRVNLPLLYARSDVEQTLAYELIRQEGMVEGEQKAVDVLAQKISPAPVHEVSRDLASGDISRRKHLLWVDDRPSNNENVARVLQNTLAVVIDTATSTPDALQKLSDSKYELVISDLGRPEGRFAGLDLVSQLRQNQNNVTFIIYSRMATPELEAQAAKYNATTTNSPLILIEKVTRLLQD